MFATIPHGLDMQIGIIGAGGATRGIHLPGFKLCADAEVTVVCDADRDAARATGVRETCTDYREVLARRVLRSGLSLPLGQAQQLDAPVKEL